MASEKPLITLTSTLNSRRCSQGEVSLPARSATAPSASSRHRVPPTARAAVEGGGSSAAASPEPAPAPAPTPPCTAAARAAGEASLAQAPPQGHRASALPASGGRDRFHRGRVVKPGHSRAGLSGLLLLLLLAAGQGVQPPGAAPAVPGAQPWQASSSCNCCCCPAPLTSARLPHCCRGWQALRCRVGCWPSLQVRGAVGSRRHSAAPLGARVPGGQRWHTLALALPRVGTCVPSGQALGWALPEGHQLPAGQGRQKTEEGVGVKAPAGQSWHSLAPAELKRPGLHSLHRPSAALCRY